MSQHREISIKSFGAADKALLMQSRESKPVGPDEIAIAVAYSGINFADIVMRLGLYPDAPPKPFVPGYEVSGTVAELGANVKGFRIGDEVVAGTVFGGYTSRLVVSAANAFARPSHLTLAQGAALPVTFFTAHLALVEMSRIRKGDRVLIESAAGGVGNLALQLCRAYGAHAVGLTSSPSKKALIESYGATAMTEEEFWASDEKNFDIVLNSSGGASINKQRKRLNLTGRIVCFGFSSGIKDGKKSMTRAAIAAIRMPILPVLKLFGANTGVYGLNALHILQNPEWSKRLTAAALQANDLGLVPHVGQVFSADEAAAAHRALETKKASGKLLLSW